MPSPTETRRLLAAAQLADAIGWIPNAAGDDPATTELLPVVDALAEYCTAYAIDQLTAVASAMIFRKSRPPDEDPESESSPES
ncbi:MAG: hypothetical protein V3V75_05380 [Thermoguttaceae bacterium]